MTSELGRRSIVLVALVGATLIGALVGLVGTWSWNGILIATGAGIAAVPLVAVLFGRRFDPFEPVHLFSASYAVLFVVRPMIELSAYGSPQPIGGQDPSATYSDALLLGILGSAAYLAGYYAFVGRAIAGRLRVPASIYSDRRLFGGVIGMTLLGSGAFAAFILNAGGAEALMTIFGGRNQASFDLLSQPAGYLFSGLVFITGAALLLLATVDRWWSARGFAAFLLLIYSNLTSIGQGGRIWLLPCGLAVVVLWYLRKGTRPRLVTIIVAATLVFFVGITVPREYRVVSTREGSPIDVLARALGDPLAAFRGFILGNDTAMPSTLAIEIATIPRTLDYQLGMTYVVDLARPMPRALWPEKPTELDVTLMRLIWPTYAQAHVQFTFSLFGEPYANWGWIGVIGVCAVFGGVWRTLYEWMTANADTPLVRAIFAMSLPFLIIYVRGGIGVDYQRQVIYLAPALAVAWIAARKGRRDRYPAPRDGRLSTR